MFFCPIFSLGVSVFLAELQVPLYFVLVLSSKTVVPPVLQLNGWCSKYSVLCSLVMLRCSGLFFTFEIHSVPARCANPDICLLVF